MRFFRLISTMYHLFYVWGTVSVAQVLLRFYSDSKLLVATSINSTACLQNHIAQDSLYIAIWFYPSGPIKYCCLSSGNRSIPSKLLLHT